VRPRRGPARKAAAAFWPRPERYSLALAYDERRFAGGMCALSLLERRLGRARFDRLLRGVVAQHRDGILTTADFVAAVRAAAPARVDVDALLRHAGISSGR